MKKYDKVVDQEDLNEMVPPPEPQPQVLECLQCPKLLKLPMLKEI